MDHSKITPKLRLVVQSSIDSFSNEDEDNSNAVVGMCIHIFTKGKKKDFSPIS